MYKCMSQEKKYYVYIMSSHSRVLYIGITSNLQKRVHEHKLGAIDGFTKKYKCKYLVYYEETGDVDIALNREKQLKKWNRQKKVGLIERINLEWIDLSGEWLE